MAIEYLARITRRETVSETELTIFDHRKECIIGIDDGFEYTEFVIDDRAATEICEALQLSKNITFGMED